MDSPSPLEEEGAVGMDTVPPSFPLRPAHEMVGGASTHHIQIMKASFFNKDDLNTTYSIPSPKLGSTHSNRRLDERVNFRPVSKSSSHQPSPSLSRHTPSQFPSHQAPSLLLSGPLPSPKPPSTLTSVLRNRGFPPPPQTAPTGAGDDALDPFTRFHTSTRRPLPLAPRAASGLQAQSAVLMATRDLNMILPMPKGSERCLCDHGLFLGRSFRVGWGPNWTLAHAGLQVCLDTSKPTTAAVTSRGWDQGGLFSTGKLLTPHEEAGLPIRAVVERVSVNSTPSCCDVVSQQFSYPLLVVSRDYHVTFLSLSHFWSPSWKRQCFMCHHPPRVLTVPLPWARTCSMLSQTWLTSSSSPSCRHHLMTSQH